MKLIIAMVLFSSYSFAEVKEFKMAKGELIVENGSGNIQIIGKTQDKVKVEYTKVKWGEKCKIVIEKEESTVKAKVEEKSSWSSTDNCRVDFNIAIPKNLAITVKSGSGELSINSIEGNIDFKTGSGDVAGKNLKSKSIVGKSGSGDISLKGSFTIIDLKTGSGKISTHFDQIQKPANFSAKSGSGDISILIPQKSTVNANFKSGSGQLKNKTSYSDNPNLNVNVKTGSGDLKIEQI